MPLKTSADDPPTLNLTSMIDVLFLLIIFFMAGTQFTELERNIALQVPQVSNAKNLPTTPQRHVINIYRDGRVALDRETITVSGLAEELAKRRQANPRISVLVRGDGEGTFQNVAAVLAACREAGVTDLGVSVRLADAQSGSNVR